MNRLAAIVIGLHTRLFRLYPKAYRDEFGAERQAVFDLAVSDAAQRGTSATLRLALREVRDLPRSVIRARRRERSQTAMPPDTNDPFAFKPASPRETLAAMAPFLIIGLGFEGLALLTNRMLVAFPDWFRYVSGFTLLAMLCLPPLFGLFKGLPRWALPYLGFFLFYLAIILGNQLLNGPLSNVFSTQKDWIVRSIFNESVWAIYLLIGVGLIVLIAAVWHPLRPFFARVRRDWTLASFILYGAALGMLFLTFDDYAYEEPYTIAAILVLAVGAWVYLHSASSRRRILALIAGVTLAMTVVAMGKVLIRPIQSWPPDILRFPWQNSVISTAIDWGWIMVVICAPALLSLLPPRKRAPATG